MTTYLLKRIAMLVPLMLGITLITFTVIHLAPGEPVDMQMAMNPKVGKEARERLTKFYGLDKPLHEQYFNWLGRLAKLDLAVLFPAITALCWTKSRNACQSLFRSIWWL